ncbi:MAG: hypothetical protein FJ320_09860 [SAR202 cluster bacterium]|nr:hypothetical protein [SAR202 cluster bacterium]
MPRQLEWDGKLARMTVGVMGSAGGMLKDEVCQRVRRLGVIIGRRGHVLITGACPGLPHEAVIGAKSAGGIVVGISPGLNLKEHVTKYHSPTRGYDAMVYTGSGLMGREIENIRSCDVVIFAGGRSGTLGEFAIAYDEGKVIGVLQNSGGISGHLDKIISMINKKTSALVCYEADPEKLLDKLEEAYRNQIVPQHLKFLADHNPDGVLEE